MTTVLGVAKYVLSKCGAMTTMKLQKIVYYCQAWSLVWDEEPLFEEEFEAWANGPVCYELFSKHKGLFSVKEEDFSEIDITSCFSKDNIETMDAVIRDYGEESPQWLSDSTHSEDPWKDARRGCLPGQYCNNVISKESMQQYYGGL